MAKIEVSIVVPTHGRLSLLKRAISSVVAQDFRYWECLVVSDSRSEFQEVSAMVADFTDSRIRFLEGKRAGANASRNRGMDAASGEIIAFLDDDDYWKPQKLTKHVELHQQADFVHSKCIFEFHSRKGTFRYVFPDRRVAPNRLTIAEEMRSFQWCPRTSSCVTVSRKIVQVERWDEELASFQDWDMWYRLLTQEKVRIAFLDTPVCVFYQHLGDRVSKDVKRRIPALQALAEKHSLIHNYKGHIEEFCFNMKCRELREAKATLSLWETLCAFLKLVQNTIRKDLRRFPALCKTLLMPSPYSRFFVYLHRKHRA